MATARDGSTLPSERATSAGDPRIVIGVPCEITQVEKRAVVDSAYRAKASEVHLVEQAMVAAIGAGLPITEPCGNMIVDIGGGTTDVAVISLSGIVYSRSVRVAGNEMDDAIMQYLKRKYNLLIGERTAEQIKIQIGSAYPLDKPLTMEIKGRNLIEGVPKTITIDDSEIREALSECVATIMNAIRVALEAHAARVERRHQRPGHRADRRGRAAEKPGPPHPRGNRASGFDRRRPAGKRGAGDGQDADRFQAAAQDLPRVGRISWILMDLLSRHQRYRACFGDLRAAHPAGLPGQEQPGHPPHPRVGRDGRHPDRQGDRYGSGGTVDSLGRYVNLHNLADENKQLGKERGQAELENQYLKSELRSADRAVALGAFQARNPSKTLPRA